MIEKDARMAMASHLEGQQCWKRTNQDAHSSNGKVHLGATESEIRVHRNGKIDYVLFLFGWLGRKESMKQRSSSTSIVMIEPAGSTLSGGKPATLAAGAGKNNTPGMIKHSGHIIDYFSHRDDATALQACLLFRKTEGFFCRYHNGLRVSSSFVSCLFFFFLRKPEL